MASLSIVHYLSLHWAENLFVCLSVVTGAITDTAHTQKPIGLGLGLGLELFGF
jgi:hypothetical protein